VHKDYLGNELFIGSRVVYMTLSYRDLRKATVTRLTPKMVILDDSVKQLPSQCIAICEETNKVKK
jgi:hypothetical protein